MFDYRRNEYGKACLDIARTSKSSIGFGAILIARDGAIIAQERNRRATDDDRQLLPRVDYAIHAEQACIASALRRGIDPTGCEIFVLGVVLRGPKKGTLSVREERFFTCRKCAHALAAYGISVWIPLVNGWSRLTPEEAFETATERGGNSYWKHFVREGGASCAP